MLAERKIFLLILGVFFQNSVEASRGVAPWIKMNDGREIPGFALGTWLGYSKGKPITPDGTEVIRSVEWAIDAGYRHIDTAWIYNTEDQVGTAVNNKIKEGVVTRDEVFVTTKLFNNFHRKEQVVPILRDSLKKMGLEYVDLYLIHSPDSDPPNIDYLETWQGMIEAKNLGLTKSIGLSNFNPKQIDRIIANSSVVPAVLQNELSINVQQPELLKYCKEKGIVFMSYIPFGSLFPRKAKPDAPPPRVDDPQLVKIAEKYKKTVPQVVLRYLVELGTIPIPKSLTKSRIEENINIFDFQLDEEDKKIIKRFDVNYFTVPPWEWSKEEQERQ